MFAKLLKHEWKASWGLLGILSLAALGIGVLGAVVLRVLFLCGELVAQGADILAVLMIMLTVSLVFMGIALSIYAAAVQFFLLYRFYRNKFTDEGYLTFTLPANSHQLFLSSYVNMLLWTLISGAVLIAAVLIAGVFGPVKEGLVNAEVLAGIGNTIQEVFLRFWELDDGFIWMTMLLQMLVSVLCAPVLSMSCITVGAVVAKKHKILAAFGIYYGLSAIMGMVGMLFTVLSSIVVQDIYHASILVSYVIQSLLQLGMAVGGYFLSAYLMKHKLNLP